MKTVIINAGPRKDFNTARLLKEAYRGASEFSEAKYYDLYDLSYTGCVSCLACKRKTAPVACRCYRNDGLTEVLEDIYSAGRIIIGSPVYFSQVTSGMRALMERVIFPALSYDDYKSTYPSATDVDIFLTMNVGKEAYDAMYRDKFTSEMGSFALLNGKVNISAFCDTLQVDDYSKYHMAGFSEEHKRKVYEEFFPSYLDLAYRIGKGEK